MSTLTLARAIENIEDADELRALAVVRHLSPALKQWREAEDLRSKIAAARTEITKQTAFIARLTPEVEEAREAFEKVEARKSTFKKLAIASAVVGALSLFLNFPPGFLLGAIGAGIFFFLVSKTGKELEESREALVNLEQSVAAASTAAREADAARASYEQQLVKRSTGFPEVRIADIQFPLATTQLGDRSLLLDLSGTQSPVTLHTVDVSALQTGVQHIAERARELLEVPPMLSPATESDDDFENTLYGEEEELQELVSDFTQNLGKLRDSKLSLPLIDAESGLAQRLYSGNAKPSQSQTAVVVGDNVDLATSVQAFMSEANRTRNQALAVFAELREVFERLERACGLYSVARTASMNTIHDSLLGVLSRANWCNRRFYCPRTILSPAYIQEVVGIDLDHAYQMSLDDLFERLLADPEIKRRFDTQPTLESELTDAYRAVQEFMSGVTLDDAGNLVRDSALPTHIERQIQESIKHLRNVLQKAMTGSAYPILNFSPAAQLYFDPDSGDWSSPTTPYTYSTPDIVRFGSMVKAYSDVMIPLWEHLWTEKADFRKSELFRTNESMIRMSEKESEKLIEVANQFRADMRTVREHVFLLESDLTSKYGEITTFRDGMNQLGLLSPKALANLSDDRLAEIVQAEFDRASMDRFETVLGAIPQAQAEIRGTVQDPIDLIREPSALLPQLENVNTRLLGTGV